MSNETEAKRRLRVISHAWHRSLGLPGRWQWFDDHSGEWRWTCSLKTVRDFAERRGYDEKLRIVTKREIR